MRETVSRLPPYEPDRERVGEAVRLGVPDAVEAVVEMLDEARTLLEDEMEQARHQIRALEDDVASERRRADEERDRVSDWRRRALRAEQDLEHARANAQPLA